jgi:CheY-like chemotaxis protein
MGGKIYLDDDYESGIPDHPGTRFVIDLCTSSIIPPALKMEDHVETDTTDSIEGSPEEEELLATPPQELPESLSVLFVDDDHVLRKLFSRALKRIRPNWSIREAANGETALQLVESEPFDLIFMDMYMASVEKQLLGTEAVAALRANGVTSRICGLSANDIEMEFFDAGANAFMFKPFPCDKASMTNALRKILFEDDRRSSYYHTATMKTAEEDKKVIFIQ